ncbi:DUF1329 domain-containing protein [Pseudomonas aeruginosa]|jgi:hypothetical protein|uniref:DUF1329 domain-containing protein n=1 Tax=Pseudomonas aeruginosa TaxID=287 RepID=UPI0029661CF1|nr:DUF1329 domain-containing protein [Pseudomonas aeruginosa]MDW2963195.1 DUF1329 domain-containing protein [Pseudomonas aeruginosa]HEP8117525.1 DUF1329 domain-containing protein [Pseudomonas aeruginosa]
MKNKLISLSLLTMAVLSTGARAAVTPEEAAKLGGSLTPIGAEKAGNTDGSIPAWTGGLSKDAGAVDAAGFLADPFANEQPLFTITVQNVEQYKDKLTPGQIAMFKRYPDTYKMNVYPSHRTAALPDKVYEIAKKNALNTSLVGNGNGLQNFSGYYPFPIPKSGAEVIWNHITRYRGGSVSRQFAQIVPDPRGGFTPVIMSDVLISPDHISDYNPAKQGNILFYWKQGVDAPARLAGNINLVHETIDQVKEPRMAWVYNAGQRRVRRAPQVAYDGPIATAEGHRVSDNYDLFNGATDRYDWKLEGKKELYIPYNSYKLDSPKLKYSDIIRAGHMNTDLQRYELHRVWHVTATLKTGERHIYAKRDFYFDEDTWQAAVIDHYDGRGSLWRVAEAHALQVYDNQLTWYAAETLHDLISGRYLVLGLKNEQKSSFKFGFTAYSSEFTPNALRQSGVR